MGKVVGIEDAGINVVTSRVVGLGARIESRISSPRPTARPCLLSPVCGTAGKIPLPASGCCLARLLSRAPRPGWSPITSACRCCSKLRILTAGSTVRLARKRSNGTRRNLAANGRYRRGLTAPVLVTTTLRSSNRSSKQANRPRVSLPESTAQAPPQQLKSLLRPELRNWSW